MFKSLREDVEAVFQRDPAARSRLEVVLCYPGVHALIFHRLGASRCGCAAGSSPAASSRRSAAS